LAPRGGQSEVNEDDDAAIKHRLMPLPADQSPRTSSANFQKTNDDNIFGHADSFCFVSVFQLS
jgi:hypothetical protein